MAEPEVGGRFGRYDVEARIGAGGMGSVYRARDVTLNRPVALKVMRHARADPSDDETRRFSREARVLATLRAPGIVEILDVGEVDGTPYLAMAWIEGQPLSARLRDVMPTGAALALLVGIAESLRDAHRQGVVHRDLKPANVVIGRDERPILVDFGIAKRIAADASPHPLTFATSEDLLLGTPSYMAPEQTVTAKVDARADQFAWGVIAYQLLAGLHPRHLTPAFPLDAPPPLASQRPELSAPVLAVVDRALALLPADRFASMDDLLVALTRAPSPAGGRSRPPRRGPRRGLLFFATAGGTLVAAGSMLGAAAYFRRTPEAPSSVPEAAPEARASDDDAPPAPSSAAVPVPPPGPADDAPPELDASAAASRGPAPNGVKKRCRCADAHGGQLCYATAPSCWCADPDGPNHADLCKIPWVLDDESAACRDWNYGKDLEARGAACTGYRRGPRVAPVNTVVTNELACAACANATDLYRPGVAGARCEAFAWGSGAPTTGTLKCDSD